MLVPFRVGVLCVCVSVQYVGLKDSMIRSFMFHPIDMRTTD